MVVTLQQPPFSDFCWGIGLETHGSQAARWSRGKLCSICSQVKSQLGVFLCGVCRVYSGFLPQSKDINIWVKSIRD